MATKRAAPTWSDIKAKLADFDRKGLLDLVKDLYASSKDNQMFLHARLDLGEDVLKPYKTVISRWLWPDVFKNQHTSVAKAKKAIADYDKAIGQPVGLAELMVFYCEQASGFGSDVGLQDEGYYDALARMFERTLKIVVRLPDEQRVPLWQRLDDVRHTSHNFGYGVSDYMDDLLAEHGTNG
jgi:hypothetical protein